MMRSVHIVFIILISAFTSCLNPTKNGNEYTFGIYFLKNDTLSYHSAKQIGLKNLPLKNKPLISDDDINYYDQEKEEFVMSSDFWNENSKELIDSLNFKIAVKPIVLKIQGERFFLGSFIGVISSLAYAGPTLNIWPVYNSEIVKLKFFFSPEDMHYKESMKYQRMLENFSL